jgi:hypothetical protein
VYGNAAYLQVVLLRQYLLRHTIHKEDVTLHFSLTILRLWVLCRLLKAAAAQQMVLPYTKPLLAPCLLIPAAPTLLHTPLTILRLCVSCRLLKAAAAARTNNTQQHQGTGFLLPAATAATPTSSTNRSSIHAAVDAVYPRSEAFRRSSAASAMLRAAALFLADQAPAYRANCARVAAAVDAAVGSPAKLGLSMKFKEIIAADKNACFRVMPSPHKSEQYLQLDVQRLLQLQEMRHTRVAAAAASARTFNAAAAAGSSPSSSWAAVASSSSSSGSSGASSIATAFSGGSSSSPSISNMPTAHDHAFSLGGALLSTAPPPSPPAAACLAAEYADMLRAYQAAALALMPPLPPSDDDASGDVIWVPDDDEQLYDTMHPAAAAAAAPTAELEGLGVAQDLLACSREVQHDAGQWPVLQ